ncbi:hypothetical protein GW750_00255 [bacterium]|nr:hypothetical protein [bacterium]
MSKLSATNNPHTILAHTSKKRLYVCRRCVVRSGIAKNIDCTNRQTITHLDSVKNPLPKNNAQSSQRIIFV